MLTPFAASVFVVLARVFFQVRKLNIKRFQEYGGSPLTALYLQSFALLPATLLLLLTFRTEYLAVIFASPIFAALGVITVLWLLSEIIGFYLLDYFASLAFLSAISSLISIPAALCFGYFLNHDQPNAFIFGSLALLAVAVFLQPTPKDPTATKVTRPRVALGLGLWLAVGIAIFGTVADEFNGALYRFILQKLDATLFVIAIYTTLIMLATTLFFWVRPVPTAQKKLAYRYRYLAFSIAPLWFLASLPEGYGYADVPIFTYLAISAIAFLADAVSDLKNKRIRLTLRTATFCVLVLSSILLATWSLQGAR